MGARHCGLFLEFLLLGRRGRRITSSQPRLHNKILSLKPNQTKESMNYRTREEVAKMKLEAKCQLLTSRRQKSTSSFDLRENMKIKLKTMLQVVEAEDGARNNNNRLNLVKIQLS